jgi:hypothetical protein
VVSAFAGRLRWSATLLVCTAGLVVELACGRGWLGGESAWRSGLSLSYEGNLPTWYATVLLWTAALGLARIAEQAPAPMRQGWAGLAAIFALLSLDEAIELHESLGGAELHGPLYFSWVVPGALLTGLFGLVYLRFWLRLPSPTRRAFAISCAIYVGAALGMELPLGAWTERHGDDNLVYGLLDFAEESLELVGLTYFLDAIARAASDYPSTSPSCSTRNSFSAGTPTVSRK